MVDSHIHRDQGDRGWKFELKGIELNQKMADFLMESALKDMGIEAKMKEVTIVKKGPTATSLLLTYRELYQMKEEGAREKLIEVYRQTGSISKTARICKRFRNVLRKWRGFTVNEGVKIDEGGEVKILKPIGARMTRIRKSSPYQNGVVERSHKIDDEEFYIPYLYRALNWIYYYHTQRAHFGRYINGKTPYEKVSIMPNIKKEIALFPPFLLEEIIPV